MERAYLGETGVCVSRVILGCGNFGGIGSAPAFFGGGESPEEAAAIMDAAWEAGITTFDTADAYGGGRSETSIGDWLRTKGPEVRDALVLSTKTFNPMGEGEDHGLAPARVKRQLESSLRRLGVERVQMYLTHDSDPDVPIAETLGVLDELQHAGKIDAYGASNVDAAQLRQALAVDLPTGYGWVQNSYSLLDRGAENELLPLCAERGLGFTPFSPLAGGWLTGKYRRNEPPPAGSRMTVRPEPYEHLQDAAVFDLLEDLERRAVERRTTMAALFCALAASVFLYAVIPKGFFPQQDNGVILCTTEAAQDISYTAMVARQREVVKVVLADPGVQSAYYWVGANPTVNTGRILIDLKPFSERSSSATEVLARLRKAALSLAKETEFGKRMVNAGRLSVPTIYDSSLSTADCDVWRGGPRPGASMLDAPIAAPAGEPMYLTDAFIKAGKRFTLLEFSNGAAAVPPDDVGVIRVGGEGGFSDSTGLAAARYDAEPGSAYLLRPDGYVAARFRHPTRTALDAALARAAGNN